MFRRGDKKTGPDHDVQQRQELELFVQERIKQLTANVEGTMREEVIIRVSENVQKEAEALNASLTRQCAQEVDNRMREVRVLIKDLVRSEVHGVASSIDGAYSQAIKCSEACGALQKGLEADLEEFKSALANKEQLWDEIVDRIMASIARSVEMKMSAVVSDKEKPMTVHNVQGEERVVLNVGGGRFETFRSTLAQYPDTLLGAMFAERNSELLQRADEYFFDRDSQLFPFILAYYRSGIVVKPSAIPRALWEQEMDYWHLPKNEVQEQESCETLGERLRSACMAKEKELEGETTKVNRYYEWLKPTVAMKVTELIEKKDMLYHSQWKILRVWRHTKAFNGLEELNIPELYNEEFIEDTLTTDGWLLDQIALKFLREDDLKVSFSQQYSVVKRDGNSISTCVLKPGPAITLLVHRGTGGVEGAPQEDESGSCIIS